MSRLLELRVRNLALVREARLDCEAGFGVLTGETGSGKSLCVAALRFVLGGRVEGDLLAEGSAVSAVFDAQEERPDMLDGLGVPPDELLTLTREVGAGGRATCRVNGALVSQATLRAVGEQLAEVTSQGASHRLLRRSWQRRLLDSSGGIDLAEARSAMAAAHAGWRDAELASRGAAEATQRTAAEIEAAASVIAGLEAVELHDGEEEDLNLERLRLRHAVAIAAAAADLGGAATGDDDGGGAAELLERAVSAIDALGGVDAGLAGLGAEAASVVVSLRELGLAARRHADRVEFDAGRLELVEQRLDTLARVRRRYGSVAAAISALEAARRIHHAAAVADLDAVEARRIAARAAAADAAAELTAVRIAAARRLEQSDEQRLRVLELPHARFRVVLGSSPAEGGLDLGDGPRRCDAEGVDTIDFRLAANRGGVPLPLDEGPSGGELSRLALALAAVAARESQPMLVLDEVDTGIGGETAARVGDLLAEIGGERQVLAVTHRPEIAARAGWHLWVVKRERSGGAVSLVERVDGDARVDEIARLMSGRATAAALARASELLAEGVPRHRRAG